VIATWATGRDREAVVVSDHVEVMLDNASDEAVSVDLTLFGWGLDQRMVPASIGRVDMEARQTKAVRVSLEDFPIQSVGAPVQIDLGGQVTGSTWSGHLQTDSLYAQFDDGYSVAYVSATSAWASMAMGLVGRDNTRIMTILASQGRKHFQQGHGSRGGLAIRC